MTNYNERLDKILRSMQVEEYGIVSKADTKQAITSLIKELVDEQIVQALKELKEEVIGEVPSKMNTDNWKYDRRVAELKLWQHQAIDNKVKELEAWTN